MIRVAQAKHVAPLKIRFHLEKHTFEILDSGWGILPCVHGIVQVFRCKHETPSTTRASITSEPSGVLCCGHGSISCRLSYPLDTLIQGNQFYDVNDIMVVDWWITLRGASWCYPTGRLPASFHGQLLGTPSWFRRHQFLGCKRLLHLIGPCR